MKIKGNKTLKFLLRADYVWLFIIGVASASAGIQVLIEENNDLPEDATLFIGLIALVIGIAIIVIGFYRKKQYEKLINKHKL